MSTIFHPAAVTGPVYHEAWYYTNHLLYHHNNKETYLCHACINEVKGATT